MKRTRSDGLRGDLLVIGYGNELRSDDGAGLKVAERVARCQLPGVQSVACHQLVPELAVSVAAAGRVIFVDAAMDCDSVCVREVEPLLSTQAMTHAVDPGALLELARILYQRSPPALTLTIPAEDFGFGSKLSDRCRRGMRTALNRIRVLAKNTPTRMGLLREGQKAESVCQSRFGGAPRKKT